MIYEVLLLRINRCEDIGIPTGGQCNGMEKLMKLILWLQREWRMGGDINGMFVGDQFSHQLETCIIVVHHRMKGGMEIVTFGLTFIGDLIATCIIVSDDVLTYNGRLTTQCVDQKLKGGNFILSGSELNFFLLIAISELISDLNLSTELIVDDEEDNSSVGDKITLSSTANTNSKFQVENLVQRTKFSVDIERPGFSKGFDCKGIFFSGTLLSMMAPARQSCNLECVDRCIALQKYCVALQKRAEYAWYESETDVLIALITLYAKCHDVEFARRVFDGMVVKDRISWNAMISGYFENEKCCEGLGLFLVMQSCSIFPDLMTLTSLISACELLGDREHVYKNHVLNLLKSAEGGRNDSCKTADEFFDFLHDVKQNYDSCKLYVQCLSVKDALGAVDRYAKLSVYPIAALSHGCSLLEPFTLLLDFLLRLIEDVKLILFPKVNETTIDFDFDAFANCLELLKKLLYDNMISVHKGCLTISDFLERCFLKAEISNIVYNFLQSMLFSGCELKAVVSVHVAAKSNAECPLYLILGMLCGVVRVAFNQLVTWFTKVFQYLKKKFALHVGIISLTYPGFWLFAQLAAAKVFATDLCTRKLKMMAG